jgi:hypothetical protein
MAQHLVDNVHLIAKLGLNIRQVGVSVGGRVFLCDRAFCSADGKNMAIMAARRPPDAIDDLRPGITWFSKSNAEVFHWPCELSIENARCVIGKSSRGQPPSGLPGEVDSPVSLDVLSDDESTRGSCGEERRSSSGSEFRISLGSRGVFVAEERHLIMGEVHLAVCAIEPSEVDQSNLSPQWRLTLAVVPDAQSLNSEEVSLGPEVTYQSLDSNVGPGVSLSWKLFRGLLRGDADGEDSQYVAYFDPAEPAESLLEREATVSRGAWPWVRTSNMFTASGHWLTFEEGRWIDSGLPWSEWWATRRFHQKWMRHYHEKDTLVSRWHPTAIGDLVLVGARTEDGNPSGAAVWEFVPGVAASESLIVEVGTIFRFVKGGALDLSRVQGQSDLGSIRETWGTKSGYTAQVTLIPPNAAHSVIRYTNQPANECLYELPPDENDASAGKAAIRPVIAEWSNSSPSIPLAPFAGLVGDDPDNPTTVSNAIDFQSRVLSPTRAKTLAGNHPPRTDQVFGQTASGISLAIGGGREPVRADRKTIVLGSGMQGSLSLTGRTKDVNEWFCCTRLVVLKNNDESIENRPVDVQGKVAVGDWKLHFDENRLKPDACVIIKLCEGSLISLLEASLPNSPERLLAAKLRGYGAADVELKDRLESTHWRGVILLDSINLELSSLPASVQWAFASRGNRKISVTADYIGYDAGRAFPKGAEMGSFFGRIGAAVDGDSVPPPPQWSLYYDLSRFVVTFCHSTITEFHCVVAVSVQAVLGQGVDEASAPIEINGVHVLVDGVDRYDFVMKAEKLLLKKSPFSDVMLASVTAVYHSNGGASGQVAFSWRGVASMRGRGGDYWHCLNWPFLAWRLQVCLEMDEGTLRQVSCEEEPFALDLEKFEGPLFKSSVLPMRVDAMLLHSSPTSVGRLGFASVTGQQQFTVGVVGSLELSTLGSLASSGACKRVTFLLGWTPGDAPDSVVGIRFPEGPLDIGVQGLFELSADNVVITSDRQGSRVELSGLSLAIGGSRVEQDGEAVVVNGGGNSHVGFYARKANKLAVGLGVHVDAEFPLSEFPPLRDIKPSADARTCMALVHVFYAGVPAGIRMIDPDLYEASWGSFKLGYRKVGDRVGEFSLSRQLESRLSTIGGLSFELPRITIRLATSGAFSLDCGFPYQGDFSRSMQIFQPPWYGAGGFVLSGGRTGQVTIGVGLAVGLGINLGNSIAKATGTLAVYGVVYGTAEVKTTTSGAPPAVSVIGIGGEIGVRATLHVSVSFQVVKATVDILAIARSPVKVTKDGVEFGAVTVKVSANATVTLYEYYDWKGKKHKEQVSYEYEDWWQINPPSFGKRMLSHASVFTIRPYATRSRQLLRSNAGRHEELGHVGRRDSVMLAPRVNVAVAPYLHAVMDAPSDANAVAVVSLMAALDELNARHLIDALIVSVVLKGQGEEGTAEEWREAVQNPEQWDRSLAAINGVIHLEQWDAESDAVNGVGRYRVAVPDAIKRWEINETSYDLSVPWSESGDSRFRIVDPSVAQSERVYNDYESLVSEKWRAFVVQVMTRAIDVALEVGPPGVVKLPRQFLRDVANLQVDHIMVRASTDEGCSPAIPESQGGRWKAASRIAQVTVPAPNDGVQYVDVRVVAREQPGRRPGDGDVLAFRMNVDKLADARRNFTVAANEMRGSTPPVWRCSQRNLWSVDAGTFNATPLNCEGDSVPYLLGPDLVSRLARVSQGGVKFQVIKTREDVSAAFVLPLTLVQLVEDSNDRDTFVVRSRNAAGSPNGNCVQGIKIFRKRSDGKYALVALDRVIIRRFDLSEEEGPPPARVLVSSSSDSASAEESAGFWDLCRSSGQINGTGYVLSILHGRRDLHASHSRPLADGEPDVLVVGTLRDGEARHANAVFAKASGCPVSLSVLDMSDEPLLLVHAAEGPAGCLGMQAQCDLEESDNRHRDAVSLSAPLGYECITFLPTAADATLDMSGWRSRPREPKVNADRRGQNRGSRDYDVILRHPSGWSNGMSQPAPYKAIGQELRCALVQEDFHGNLIDTGVRASGRVLYHDPLVPLGEWPGVSVGMTIVSVTRGIATWRLTMSSQGEKRSGELWDLIRQQLEDDRWSARVLEVCGASTAGVDVSVMLRDIANLDSNEDRTYSVEGHVAFDESKITSLTMSVVLERVPRAGEDEALLFPQRVPDPVLPNECEPCRRRVSVVYIEESEASPPPWLGGLGGALGHSSGGEGTCRVAWYVGAEVLTLRKTSPLVAAIRPLVKRRVTTSVASDVDVQALFGRVCRIAETVGVDRRLSYPQGGNAGRPGWDQDWRQLCGYKRELAKHIGGLVSPLYDGENPQDERLDDAGQTLHQAALRDVSAAYDTALLVSWEVRRADSVAGCVFSLRVTPSSDVVGVGGVAERRGAHCRVRQTANCVTALLHASDVNVSYGQSCQPVFELDAVWLDDGDRGVWLTLSRPLEVKWEDGEAQSFAWTPPLRTVPRTPVVLSQKGLMEPLNGAQGSVEEACLWGYEVQCDVERDDMGGIDERDRVVLDVQFRDCHKIEGEVADRFNGGAESLADALSLCVSNWDKKADGATFVKDLGDVVAAISQLGRTVGVGRDQPHTAGAVCELTVRVTQDREKTVSDTEVTTKWDGAAGEKIGEMKGFASLLAGEDRWAEPFTESPQGAIIRQEAAGGDVGLAPIWIRLAFPESAGREVFPGRGVDIRRWTNAKVRVSVTRNQKSGDSNKQVNGVFVFEAESDAPGWVGFAIDRSFMKWGSLEGFLKSCVKAMDDNQKQVVWTLEVGLVAFGHEGRTGIEPMGRAAGWDRAEWFGPRPLLRVDLEGTLIDGERIVIDDLIGDVLEARSKIVGIDPAGASREGYVVSVRWDVPGAGKGDPYRQVARLRRVWCDSLRGG